MTQQVQAIAKLDAEGTAASLREFVDILHARPPASQIR